MSSKSSPSKRVQAARTGSVEALLAAKTADPPTIVSPITSDSVRRQGRRPMRKRASITVYECEEEAAEEAADEAAEELETGSSSLGPGRLVSKLTGSSSQLERKQGMRWSQPMIWAAERILPASVQRNSSRNSSKTPANCRSERYEASYSTSIFSVSSSCWSISLAAEVQYV